MPISSKSVKAALWWRQVHRGRTPFLGRGSQRSLVVAMLEAIRNSVAMKSSGFVGLGVEHRLQTVWGISA